ncbi:CLUMA_CG015043, isoform A [Clunio marinus]|uniref:CLUMA_CG015043, isoform A n=1 Tax=Clunio marinus TaxID=568069 RepID=A0A1J1IQK5_9DIPT|nr:CLUMA_CG015043, isoform A [Clunio marinus]
MQMTVEMRKSNICKASASTTRRHHVRCSHGYPMMLSLLVIKNMFDWFEPLHCLTYFRLLIPQQKTLP